MPGEWLTPVSLMKNRTQVYEKLENYKPCVKVDLENEISYFNNSRATAKTAAYDHFFAYTKTFPIYDPRKERDNRKYLPCIRETIFHQEWPKPVPALISMNYGKRPFYDLGTQYNRQSHIANFYRRREVIPAPEKTKYLEEVDFILS